MDFSEALKFIKEGEYLQRKGWNGKNMFVYLVGGTLIHTEQLRNEAKKAEEVYDKNCKGQKVYPKNIQICSHIDMRAADGSIVVGWLASQTDILAEDWQLYVYEEK
jgi:hypothetical protein